MKTKYKVKMTRPEFLDKFIDKYTFDIIDPIIPEQTKLIYAIYTILLESDLESDDIKQVHCDGSSVVVKLASKELAKDVKKNYNKERMRFGFDIYQIKIKLDKAFLYVSLNFVETHDTNVPEEMPECELSFED